MEEQRIYEIILMGYPKSIGVKADRHDETDRGIELYIGDEKVASYTSVKGWRILSDATQEVRIVFGGDSPHSNPDQGADP